MSKTQILTRSSAFASVSFQGQGDVLTSVSEEKRPRNSLWIKIVTAESFIRLQRCQWTTIDISPIAVSSVFDHDDSRLAFINCYRHPKDNVKEWLSRIYGGVDLCVFGGLDYGNQLVKPCYSIIIGRDFNIQNLLLGADKPITWQSSLLAYVFDEFNLTPTSDKTTYHGPNGESSIDYIAYSPNLIHKPFMESLDLKATSDHYPLCASFTKAKNPATLCKLNEVQKPLISVLLSFEERCGFALKKLSDPETLIKGKEILKATKRP